MTLCAFSAAAFTEDRYVDDVFAGRLIYWACAERYYISLVISFSRAEAKAAPHANTARRAITRVAFQEEELLYATY